MNKSVLDKLDDFPRVSTTPDAELDRIQKMAWHQTRTETTVDAMHTEVRDAAGKLRYTEIHPAYRTGDTWTKAVADVHTADVADAAGLKCSATVDKYGFAQKGWIVGIKSRKTGAQYLMKPSAMTRFNGKPTAAKIEAGIFESARDATEFAQDGNAAKWSGIFDTCSIRARVDEGGRLSVGHCVSKAARGKSEHIGTIWESATNSADAVRDMLAGSGITTVFAWTGKDGRFYFCEYFADSAFGAPDADGKIVEQDTVEHDYTTVSGALGAHTTYTAGTYYVSGTVNLGNYNLTIDASAGEVIIKGGAGVNLFNANGTGNFTTTGTTLTRRVRISSMNDDSIGEAIAGSSGTPAAGDYSRVLTVGAAITTTKIHNTTIEYATGPANSGILIWGSNAAATADTIDIDDLVISKCLNPVHASLGGAFILTFWQRNTNGAASIKRVKIANDNVYANAFSFTGININSTALTIEDCYVYCGGAAFQTGIDCSLGLSGQTGVNNGTQTIRRCLVVAPNQLHAGVTSQNFSATTQTTTISNCTLRAKITAGVNGFYCRTNNAGATMAATVNNSIVVSDGEGIAYRQLQTSGTCNVTLNNCGSYNVAARTSGTITDNNPITADPQLGNLPTGCVINTALCPFPDGYAVRNLSGYEMLGSDTFDALSVDEAVYTATGYKYAGTKNVTPGAMYALTTFTELLTSITPASGSVDGATACTLAVRGAGATQGTGTVTIGGDAAATYTAWSDTSIGITTRLGTAGAKDVVLTTYRGAVVTLAGGYTYVEPTITSVSPSSGRLGTIITITGTEYHATQGSGYVTQGVGGPTLGTIVSWSDTSIVVRAGAGSGVTDVTVVTGL